MIKYYTCDRCNKLGVPLEHGKPDRWGIVDKRDLCELCLRTFGDFLAGKAVCVLKKENPVILQGHSDSGEELGDIKALRAICNKIGTPGAYDKIPLLNRASDIITAQTLREAQR